MTYILIMATIQRFLLGIGNLKKRFQWAYDIYVILPFYLRFNVLHS
jgi:hypothetical protein